MASSLLEQPVPRTIQARENRRLRLNHLHQRLPSLHRSETVAIQNDSISKRKEASRSNRLACVLQKPAPLRSAEKDVSFFSDDETVTTAGSDSYLTIRSSSSPSSPTDAAKSKPRVEREPSTTAAKACTYHSNGSMNKSSPFMDSSRRHRVATTQEYDVFDDNSVITKDTMTSSLFSEERLANESTSVFSHSTSSSSQFRRRIACGRESSYAQESRWSKETIQQSDANRLECLIVEASDNNANFSNGPNQFNSAKRNCEPAMFAHFHFARDTAFGLGDDASFSSESTKSSNSKKRVSFANDTKSFDGSIEEVVESGTSKAYGVLKGISEDLYNMLSDEFFSRSPRKDEFDAGDFETSLSNFSEESNDSDLSNDANLHPVRRMLV